MTNFAGLCKDAPVLQQRLQRSFIAVQEKAQVGMTTPRDGATGQNGTSA